MKIPGRGALAVALLAGTAAQGAVYRCERDGKVIYTDQACAAGANPAELPDVQRMDATPGADLARQYDVEAARETAARRQARADSVRSYTVAKAQQEAIRKGLIEGRVVRGMSRDQVEKILNLPERVEGRDGPRERWVYREGHRHRTITFQNGLVVADTVSSGRRP